MPCTPSCRPFVPDPAPQARAAGRRRLLQVTAAVLGGFAQIRQAALAGTGAQRHAWPRGQATPTLHLDDVEGKPWRLDALRGRPVLLNFWASWCEPCRAEMPSLELLAAHHEAQGLQVLAVNHRETDGAIRRFLGQTGLSLPILRDRDGAAAKAWGVRIFPTTIAIGRSGRAAFSVIGELDWTGDSARQWLEPVLLSPR